MKKSRTILSALAVVGIAAATVTTAAPALADPIPGWTMTSASPWTFDLDCSLLDGPFSSNFPVWSSTNDVTVNTSNCSGFDMAPGDADKQAFAAEWPGGITVGGTHYGAYQTVNVPVSGSFTIHPNTHLEIGDGTNTYTLMSTVLIPTVDNPSGFLGGTRTVNLPATDAQVFNLPGDSGNDYNLGGNPDCGLVEGDHVFATATVTVGLTGEYTFRYVTSDPASGDIHFWSALDIQSDPFLAVYSNFDPANPDANVVGCDDDGDLASQFTDPTDPWYQWAWTYESQSGQLLSDRFPQFTANLEPGTYTLVVTAYGNISAADWATQAQGPVSSDIELWGPDGGFELPNTGIDAASTIASGLVATGVIAAGIIAVVSRRRARA